MLNLRFGKWLEVVFCFLVITAASTNKTYTTTKLRYCWKCRQTFIRKSSFYYLLVGDNLENWKLMFISCKTKTAKLYVGHFVFDFLLLCLIFTLYSVFSKLDGDGWMGPSVRSFVLLFLYCIPTQIVVDNTNQIKLVKSCLLEH